MNSISMRFALASVLVALLILALTSGINYLFLKKELLLDATQKGQLIEKNTRYHIESMLSKAKESSSRIKHTFQENNFNKKSIEKILTKTLKQESSFFGMALAFKPLYITNKPFSPYYFKQNKQILYRDLASKDYNYLTKEWYKIPAKKNKPLWSEPYFDEGGGDVLMSTYSNPIAYKKKFAAILTIDLSLQKLQEMISSIDVLDSGYVILLSKENRILVHPNSSKIMQNYRHKSFKYDLMIKEKDNWIYYARVKNTDFTIVIVFPRNELFASLDYMSIISIILATMGAILLIVTMVMVSRKISEPLQTLTTITNEISKGNYNKTIDLPQNQDEIFQLSFAINTMQKSIKQNIQDLKIATIKQQRIDSELDIAKSIQMSMLPKELIQNHHLSTCALLQPAKAVGGDFYDFFYIEDKYLCFVVADVSGKGVPAAMFMSVTMSYLRAYSSIKLSASELVYKLNNTIASNNDANMFVTLFLAILDLETGKLNYVNAGHTEPYIINNKQKYEKLCTVGNPVVGAFEDFNYKDESLFLNTGAKLFLYTDGITEAFSKNDEQFGDDRLADILKVSGSININETMKNIKKSIENFTENCEQSDDITILLLEFKNLKVNS